MIEPDSEYSGSGGPVSHSLVYLTSGQMVASINIGDYVFVRSTTAFNGIVLKSSDGQMNAILLPYSAKWVRSYLWQVSNVTGSATLKQGASYYLYLYGIGTTQLFSVLGACIESGATSALPLLSSCPCTPTCARRNHTSSTI